jgi:hypothetical protein
VERQMEKEKAEAIKEERKKKKNPPKKGVAMEN